MKLKTVLLILAFIQGFYFQELVSQEPLQFLYTYQLGSNNSDQAIDMETDTEGNTVFLLNGPSSFLMYKDDIVDSGYNCYLMKVSPSGEMLNHFGIQVNGDPCSVYLFRKEILPDKSIILLGSFIGFMDYDDTTYYSETQQGFICKINPGFLPGPITLINISEEVTLTREMIVNDNGDIFVTGRSNSSVYYGPDNDTITIPSNVIKMPIWKYDSGFNLQWLKVFYSDGSFELNSKLSFADDQNNIIIGGEVTGSELHYGDQTFTMQKYFHIIVSKITSSGDIIWLKNGDSDSENRFCDINVDDNNDVYIATCLKENLYYDSTIISPYGMWREGLVFKVSNSGNLQWYSQIRNFAQNYPDIFLNEIKTKEGYVYLTGKYKWDIMLGNIYLESISGECDNFLTKMDSETGDFIYAQGFYSYAPVMSGYFSFTLAEPDIIYTSIPFKDEGAIGGTAFSSYNNSFDIILSKLKDTYVGIEKENSSGNIILFPNPAGNGLTVGLPNDCHLAEIAIYSGLGKLLMKQSITPGQNNLSLEKIASGMLIVKVYTGSGKLLSTEKIMHR